VSAAQRGPHRRCTCLGGLYNLGTATLSNSTITRNKAKGGQAGNALGGVYSTGSIAIDALTVISGNTPDNRYGC
jgi:hypothetical protein